MTELLVTQIVFEPAHYTVMENVGSFEVTVKRHGGNMKNIVYVNYSTEDGTANAGSDYEQAEGEARIMAVKNLLAAVIYMHNHIRVL